MEATHVGDNVEGLNGEDINTKGAVLLEEASGEERDPRLGGAVDGHKRSGIFARIGREVDDAASLLVLSLLGEDGQEESGHGEGGIDVDVDHAFHISFTMVHEEIGNVGIDTNIVDENADVDVLEFSLKSGKPFLRRSREIQNGGANSKTRTSIVSKLSDSSAKGSLSAIDEEDVEASLEKDAGEAEANT